MEVFSHEESSTERAPLPQDNSLRIVLNRATDPQTCPFWVGLYKSRGTGSSKEFLQIDKLDEAFKYLGDAGLAEDQPLMHSDNTGSVHRQFFLLPQSLYSQDPSAGKALILGTLASLVQKKTGLYLSPALLQTTEVRQTLADLIIGLAKAETEEVYLLTSDIGVNQLLNISLAVKEKLRETRDVWIFH